MSFDYVIEFSWTEIMVLLSTYLGTKVLREEGWSALNIILKSRGAVIAI